MRKPFWLLNLTLLFILILSIIFILYTHVKIPKYVALKKDGPETPAKKQPQLNSSIIYVDDIFGTIITPAEVPGKIEEPKLPRLPVPPNRINVIIPPVVRPKIVDPLPLKLSGVVYFGDQSKDSVFITNTRTKTEGRYKIGDAIDDAQLIKIFNNKLILLRANGQQEVIYLNQSEQEAESPSKITPVVKKLEEDTYLVDVYKFGLEVTDLNKLVFKFDVKNALEGNKIIGIRIGNISSNKLAADLGLQYNDIIAEINGLKLINTDQRIEAYNRVTSLRPGQEVKVKIIRNNVTMEYTYKLHSSEYKNQKKKVTTAKIPASPPEKAPENIPATPSVPSPAGESENRDFSVDKKDLSRAAQEAKARDMENILKLKKLNNENN